MRKIYAILPLACALTFTACDDYDDTALWEAVNGLEERIAALEQWQDETNNNIAALQKLLTTNDMITSVTPVMMGDETVGYTISFLHSDPITIYHGKKGDKGEDGVDGSTPQIGLTQQTDGNWYWTLNGSLMTDADGNPIRANGEDGKDGQDGEDGQDGRPGSTGPQGKPGADGEDGENAPTPQILLENNLPTGASIKTDNGSAIADAWYLSVDDGKTWYRVSGKDGEDGSAGDDGESFFTQKPDVDYDKGTVTFYIDGGSFEVPLHIDYIIEDDGSYTVYTANGLLAWNEAAQSDLSLNCTLTENINLTGKEWTPVGIDSDNQYTGTFDGGNHTISGLTVTGSNEYAGLFGFIGPGGTVQNVVLEGVQITSDNSSGYAGGVAGYCYRGTLENCSVSGSVSGSGSSSDVGGVVGYQLVGSITGCSSSATVKGMNRAGGVVGVTNNGAILTACYATGDVTVENDGTSYACAGGIVGMNGGNSTLTACYAAGNVSGKGSGTIHVGGAVGENYGTLTACYWSGLPDNDNGGSTKVDGTTVTWQTAVDAMNAALTNAGWQYATDDGDTPLVIKATN